MSLQGRQVGELVIASHHATTNSFGDVITLPRLLRKTIMGEERTSFMPHYQIPKARLLHREMHMSPSQFSEFTISSKEAPQLWIETRRARCGRPSTPVKTGHDLSGCSMGCEKLIRGLDAGDTIGFTNIARFGRDRSTLTDTEPISWEAGTTCWSRPTTTLGVGLGMPAGFGIIRSRLNMTPMLPEHENRVLVPTDMAQTEADQYVNVPTGGSVAATDIMKVRKAHWKGHCHEVVEWGGVRAGEEASRGRDTRGGAARIRKADYLKRHFGRYRKAFNRCPDPIWFRYSHANKTGAPLKRNCQATVRAYGELKKSTKRQRLCDHDMNDGTIKRVYPLKNRVSVVIKKLCKKNYVIAISDSESDADGETGSGALSSFSPAASPRVIVPLCTDPILDFLSSVRPSLAQFHTHFVNMGFVDDNALKAFFSWPADVQESMVRTELGQLMNPLQLHGLFVAIRAWLESTTQTG
ncbi:hypothetical protein EDD15DRAFT_2198082 [Pisolithus albus]|nr:hypothetical protein EDD15DRAFT_2198082 [Pisolithus albus]